MRRAGGEALIIDPVSGKSRLEITVEEGEQYRLGSFEVEGNTVFDDDEIKALFLREARLFRREPPRALRLVARVLRALRLRRQAPGLAGPALAKAAHQRML